MYTCAIAISDNKTSAYIGHGVDVPWKNGA